MPDLYGQIEGGGPYDQPVQQAPGSASSWAPKTAVATALLLVGSTLAVVVYGGNAGGVVTSSPHASLSFAAKAELTDDFHPARGSSGDPSGGSDDTVNSGPEYAHAMPAHARAHIHIHPTLRTISPLAHNTRERLQNIQPPDTRPYNSSHVRCEPSTPSFSR